MKAIADVNRKNTAKNNDVFISTTPVAVKINKETKNSKFAR
tara:strand:- start:749 stop:871 length:123 start_codon:yes stop_codon:yes gene_type:complete